MYVAEQFAMTPGEALDHAVQRGVGDLITTGERGIDVTMVPFAHVPARGPAAGGFGSLTTHLARTNLQWQDEGEAMMVVHGPDSYIPPGIVPPGATPARVPTVPTWNYLVVHVRGELVVHHDDDWKLASLRDLVARHEPTWRLDDGPVAGIAKLLPAIVGVELVITEVIGKAKLSQNRSTTQLQSMAATLAEGGHSPETAELMQTLAMPYAAAREQRVADARRHKRAPTTG